VAVVCLVLGVILLLPIFAEPSLRVIGHSMEPALHNGDIIGVTNFDPRIVKVGDIVVYDTGRSILTCHRVERIYHDEHGIWLYIAGDNNIWPDGWISASKVRFSVTRVLSLANETRETKPK
jgi:signal peptidase I